MTTYLTMPVTIADASFTIADGPTLLIVLACGFAMWVPAADVVEPATPATSDASPRRQGPLPSDAAGGR